MQYIPESELIINARGAVYHLNVRPDEIAPTVITVGDPDRVPLVSRHFDSIEHTSTHREFVVHTGRIGKKRITVVSTGIGTDNIDIVLNELDALVNIDFDSRAPRQKTTSLNIIRIGTAGSLQADVDVDSVVASTHGLGADNLLHFYRSTPAHDESLLLQSFITHMQMWQLQPYITTASPSLLKNFASNCVPGITVTCPGFYGPQGRVLRLGLNHPQWLERLAGFSYGPHRIVNLEMETAAIYGLGRLLGHQCLSLSVIVANRVTQRFSGNSAAAMDNLIAQVLDTIVQLPTAV